MMVFDLKVSVFPVFNLLLMTLESGEHIRSLNVVAHELLLTTLKLTRTLHKNILHRGELLL
jgi:hypothetical protein